MKFICKTKTYWQLTSRIAMEISHIHTYIHTNIHTYIHTCLYLPTYVGTYILHPTHPTGGAGKQRYLA